MSEHQLWQLLVAIERGEISAAEAQDLIDSHREKPDNESKDFWLPIISEHR